VSHRGTGSTELINHILHGIRTGQIVAWLDENGEIRLITADRATALHWRMALSAEAVIGIASERRGNVW